MHHILFFSNRLIIIEFTKFEDRIYRHGAGSSGGCTGSPEPAEESFAVARQESKLQTSSPGFHQTGEEQDKRI